MVDRLLGLSSHVRLSVITHLFAGMVLPQKEEVTLEWRVLTQS